MRRKSSCRSSIASGMIPIAAIVKVGEQSWNNWVVRSPNRGVVANGTTSSVISVKTTPTTRASMAAASTCARSSVGRWTSALPAPSLATARASSLATTVIATRPNSAGGTRWAITIAAVKVAASAAMRARVVQRRLLNVASLSSLRETAAVESDWSAVSPLAAPVLRSVVTTLRSRGRRSRTPICRCVGALRCGRGRAPRPRGSRARAQRRRPPREG